MLFWITFLALLFYAALIGYYVYHWRQLKTFTPVAAPPNLFVSVIVAARNEEKNIAALLQALSQQTLPRQRYEVIIVDDYSTDATAAVAQPFLNTAIRLIKPTVAAHLSSKKKAIEAGVAAARGPLIAVTDADCVPPANWLAQLTSFYGQKQSVFIVMPVQLKADNSLLGLFQSLDFMMLQGITAASVQAGAHSMCNGANLAYEKRAFDAVRGFEGIDGLASGDDMLLLYKIWKQYPDKVQYLKSKKAIMPTPAAATWKAFLAQRVRWSSKATYYQDKRITAVLFFVYFFNVWFIVLLVAAFFHSAYWALLAVYFFAKTAIEMLLLWPVARFFGEQKKLLFFPILQPLHIFYTVLIGLLSRQKTYEWKGRRTK